MERIPTDYFSIPEGSHAFDACLHCQPVCWLMLAKRYRSKTWLLANEILRSLWPLKACTLLSNFKPTQRANRICDHSSESGIASTMLLYVLFCASAPSLSTMMTMFHFVLFNGHTVLDRRKSLVIWVYSFGESTSSHAWRSDQIKFSDLGT